jgi:hypothetical protein
MNHDALRSFVGDDQDAIKLSPESLKFLDTTRKWSLFLAILGFIGMGLMVVGGLFMVVAGSSIGSYPGTPMPFGLIGFVYFIFAVLYFFPIYYLYKFSANMKNAIMMRNELSMEQAFRFLKNHYQFVGILTIVIISLYILMIIGGLIAVIFAGLSM